jgi:hypothetical protein
MLTGADSKSLNWKEGLTVVALTWVNVGCFFLLVWVGTVAWDRQHQIIVIERATVFDQWDAFGLPKPQPIGVVEAGTQLPVLNRFHSIEGGGIRVRLPDGRYGHLVAFESGGEYQYVIDFEPISILIFITLGFIFGWESIFLFAVRKKTWIALLVGVILVPEILSANLLMLWGNI